MLSFFRTPFWGRNSGRFPSRTAGWTAKLVHPVPDSGPGPLRSWNTGDTRDRIEEENLGATVVDAHIQRLGAVGRLFPLILSEEKTSTIRWKKGPITVQALAVNDAHENLQRGQRAMAAPSPS